MRHGPTIVLRPATPGDLPTFRMWREFPEWPRTAVSAFDQVDGEKLRSGFDDGQEIILAAENHQQKVIGLAHLSASSLPRGIAQYSVAIPVPSERSIGRGRDLMVLTTGAAFYVFQFQQIFVLIDDNKDWLISLCSSNGFSEDPDFRFLGLNASSAPAMRILRITTAEWTPLWGDEFVHKAKHDPWLMQNIDWDLLMSMVQSGHGIRSAQIRTAAKKKPTTLLTTAEQECPRLQFLPPRKVLF